MFNKLKQSIPSSWKNKLRKRFQLEVSKTEGFDSRATKRLAELEKKVFDLQPEIVSCTNEIRKGIIQNWQEKEIAVPNNLSISKHDYMYQFLEYYYADSEKAYVEYVTSGAHMIKILKDVVAQTAESFQIPMRFLISQAAMAA
jgi:hypothetical protein